MPNVQILSLYESDSRFFIIDQENIGIRKKHAIKHATYGITPYICVVKHNCKANMVKRLFKTLHRFARVSNLGQFGFTACGKPHDEKEEGLG